VTLPAALFPSSLVLALGLLALSAGPVRPDSVDDQLNAAYKKVLTRPDVDPDGLKWLETQWIAYRDAEANFEAHCAGAAKPNEEARQAALANLTLVRLRQLTHLAQNGQFDDLPSGTYRGTDAVPGGLEPHFESLSSGTYAVIRREMIALRQPALIATLIQSEKTWDAFAQVQADNEGIKDTRNSTDEAVTAQRNISMWHLDLLRLNDLQHDASLIPLPITRSDLLTAEGDTTDLDNSTTVSPDGTLRIEQPSQSESWVISNLTDERFRLEELDHDAHTNTANAQMTSEYFFSPDNRWILRTQKIYHGLDGAYLYERVSPSKLTFKPATRQPLDVLAWKFFQGATKCTPFDFTQGGVVNFVSWKPGFLRLSLNASERLTFANVDDFVVAYDLKMGQFSIPPGLESHDRQASSQSPSEN
jgi:hypothetical protein